MSIKFTFHIHPTNIFQYISVMRIIHIKITGNFLIILSSSIGPE